MRTRWPTEGRRPDDSLPRGPAIRTLCLCRLRHHATRRAENDDPLWRLLLRLSRRSGDCHELDHVLHQTLEQISCGCIARRRVSCPFFPKKNGTELPSPLHSNRRLALASTALPARTASPATAAIADRAGASPGA